MKYFWLVVLGLVFTNVVQASECQFNGQVTCPDPKAVQFPAEPTPGYQHHHRYFLNNSSKVSAGIELGAGEFPSVPNIGTIGSIGILGDYNLSPQLVLEGRMMFSSYSVTSPTYYYGYGYYNANVNYSQMEFTFGPNYRFLRSQLSPFVGAMLGYDHRYYNTGYYSYGGSSFGASDSAEVGGLVGLDFCFTKDISAGLDLRYMVPFASANIGIDYYPAYNQPVENLNYFIGGIYAKFSF